MPLLEATKFPYFITDAKLTSEKNILERLIAKPFFPQNMHIAGFCFGYLGGCLQVSKGLMSQDR